MDNSRYTDSQVLFPSPEYVQLTPAVAKVPVKVNALAVAKQIENCLALTAILPPHAILDKNHGEFCI